MVDSEKQGAFIPLRIHDVSISNSPAPHIFAVLDTANEAEDKGKKQGLYGKDVMVWGGSGELFLRREWQLADIIQPITSWAMESGRAWRSRSTCHH